MIPKTVILTTTAMLAFAANSVLCRLALGQGLIDAASFSVLRMIAGAVTLAVMVLPQWRKRGRGSGDWCAAAALLTYMVLFSFAYLSLGAGTGALILFGAVQLTMFSVALRSGEPFPMLSWVGFILAVLGLVYLVSPGVTAPDPMGAALMAIAGFAWGVYSLLGKGVANPLEATANNFIYAVPCVLIMSLFFIGDAHYSASGIALAIASGAIASGLGYVAWYSALRGLRATNAATVQLTVPIIAAFGGVIFIAEDISLRLLIASAATLGGVALVLGQRSERLPEPESGD